MNWKTRCSSSVTRSISVERAAKSQYFVCLSCVSAVLTSKPLPSKTVLAATLFRSSRKYIWCSSVTSSKPGGRRKRSVAISWSQPVFSALRSRRSESVSFAYRIKKFAANMTMIPPRGRPTMYGLTPQPYQNVSLARSAPPSTSASPAAPGTLFCRRVGWPWPRGRRWREGSF